MTISLLSHIKLGRKTPLHSGGESDIFFDIIESLSDPISRKQIIEYVDSKIALSEFYNDGIVGIELGGALIAALYAGYIECSMMRGKLPTKVKLGIYRKDGTLIMSPKAENVWLIDDVITTGTSIQEAKSCLVREGIGIKGVVSIVDRRELSK